MMAERTSDHYSYCGALGVLHQFQVPDERVDGVCSSCGASTANRRNPTKDELIADLKQRITEMQGDKPRPQNEPAPPKAYQAWNNFFNRVDNEAGQVIPRNLTDEANARYEERRKKTSDEAAKEFVLSAEATSRTGEKNLRVRWDGHLDDGHGRCSSCGKSVEGIGACISLHDLVASVNRIIGRLATLEVAASTAACNKKTVPVRCVRGTKGNQCPRNVKSWADLYCEEHQKTEPVDGKTVLHGAGDGRGWPLCKVCKFHHDPEDAVCKEFASRRKSGCKHPIAGVGRKKGSRSRGTCSACSRTVRRVKGRWRIDKTVAS